MIESFIWSKRTGFNPISHGMLADDSGEKVDRKTFIIMPRSFRFQIYSIFREKIV